MGFENRNEQTPDRNSKTDFISQFCHAPPPEMGPAWVEHVTHSDTSRAERARASKKPDRIEIFTAQNTKYTKYTGPAYRQWYHQFKVGLDSEIRGSFFQLGRRSLGPRFCRPHCHSSEPFSAMFSSFSRIFSALFPGIVRSNSAIRRLWKVWHSHKATLGV